ncbi:ABC transporter permease [Actinoalloteichus hymeniacidonis]|uniref:ABC-type dipeptide/oligopeptide/nickel transport system, permease component n=1 Tax=Actinoalloteichus hymeniacidonis TaxID=340345 RepID=A0AAC9HQ53_9PSEU|nr:ABC transporter permease [Actinoalloteichus hymeniacidonis]AOS63370.1 ABC-type dipeptide/oligopeptide/nickel transport system, permease component [Actinoalloteichus hymeniacidonis]MBB5908590.1 peptide/nickel transport system permease protein [Actinoalloteichus hymeniacidonis]
MSPAYLGRRLAQSGLVLLAAFTVTFVVLYLLPSDPVRIMLDAGGEGGYVDPAEIAALRAEHGLDQPLLIQYLGALGRVVTGDLGTSIVSGAPVTQSIGEALPHTLALAGSALLVAVLLGGAVAVGGTALRLTWLRNLVLSLPALALAAPTFWVGLLLLQFVSFQVGLLPAFGNDGIATLVLPTVTLALPTAAAVAQVLAGGLTDAWRQPYIETARAKGAGQLRVHLAHALRNAVIPTITMSGVLIGQLSAGAVVVETVFSRVGIGRLAQSAVTAQDIPVVQGLVLLAALVFVLVNLLVDLVVPLLDPRISAPAAS